MDSIVYARTGIRSSLMALAVGLVLTPAAAFAQDQAADVAGSDEAATTSGLQDIVVTAQKRTERLQDVPISALVTSGAEIQQDQLRGLTELTTRTPNVIVQKSGTTDRVFIRGIGSGNNGGFEQSVATFVDGLYYGRSKTTRSALVDVDRVEILRGPQTTYFGNNTIGGAFNITTRRPGPSFYGYARAGYEFKQNEFSIEGAAGGPLTETLGARIAGRYATTDGYITNLGSGRKDPRGDDKFVRGTLTWQPADTIDVYLKGELADETRRGGWGIQMTNCPPGPGFPGPGRFCQTALAEGVETDLDYRRTSNPGEFQHLKAQSAVLGVNFELSDKVTLSSTTGYTHFTYGSNGDNDSTAVRLHTFEQIEAARQYSQELRLSSEGGPFRWMVGAYWQQEKLKYISDVGLYFLAPNLQLPAFLPLAPYGPVGIRGGIDQKATTTSGFASVSWDIVENLTLSGGLRWSRVRKTADQFSTVITLTNDFGGGTTGNVVPDSVLALGATLTGTNPHALALARSEKDLMPSIDLIYHIDRDVMVYAKYVEGFKSGGFDQLDFSGDRSRLSYGPESAKAMEAGFKAVWRDAGVSLNLAAFRTETKNLQQSALQINGNAIFFSVVNVGKSVSQGIELGLDWVISPRFSILTDFAYLDAKFKRFPGAPCNVKQLAVTPAGQVCSQDLSGTRPEFSPKFSGSVTAEYNQPIGSYQVKAAVTTSFRSKYNLVAVNDPEFVQRGYQKIDARIGFGPAGGAWELSVIGKNLNNKMTVNFANNVPATSGSYGRLVDLPRTIAVQAMMKF
jgi:outer membrane receptor protein involved in Fe transport